MRIHLRDVLPLVLPVLAAQTSRSAETANGPNNTIAGAPQPIVVPPSQYWDGVDGLWSTFALRIGKPAQDVRVVVSTNAPQSMVVLPLGCTKQAINPIPNNCANARGGLFNPNTSSTWLDQGLFGINENGEGFEADLGYSQSADYGLETLGLGFVAGSANGPTLENQTVAGIATTSPFYLGILALGTQPVNYSTIGNFSAPSYFSSLRSQQLIPSLSWSYTAGAKYRLKDGQYGQLIFGGYDSSRYTSNSASFTLNQDIDRDFVLAVQSITYSGTTQDTLLSSPIFAFIESTDPNIWLPEAACEAFEKAFGLSIDKHTGLYLINATHYAQLAAETPEVTFTLANDLSGGETVNIVLPFNAFALSASYPFAPNDTYYFPLKKAANQTQYTLGRAFLQEAYLTVDYERGNFSVSQCVWDDGATSQIGSILSPSYATNSSTNSGSSRPATSNSKPLSGGAIAGAVIAGLAVLAIVGGAVWYFLGRRKGPAPPHGADNIGLTNVELEAPKYQGDVLPSTQSSPFLADRKTYNEDMALSRFHQQHDSRELGTGGEIHQLSAQDGTEEDYMSLSGIIEAERRAANTPQIDGRSIVYELHGSEPAPSEMDDEWSRQGRSPQSPQMPSRAWTSVSSRSTGPYIPSPQR